MVSQTERNKIRNHIRQLRQALSEETQLSAQFQLVEQVKQQKLITAGNKVAVYLANDGEINPIALIEYCWLNDAEVYLPVLHPFAKNHLAFFKYQPDTQLTKNKFGIPEPKLNAQTICPPASLSHVFLPLVAFDKHGNRMGMGGGFYDRTFSLPHPAQRRIGLAHDCQQVDALPVETWDVPLDAIITPSQTIKPD
mgnify:CR=1 FL=1